jgi:hypothetical protein
MDSSSFTELSQRRPVHIPIVLICVNRLLVGMTAGTLTCEPSAPMEQTASSTQPSRTTAHAKSAEDLSSSRSRPSVLGQSPSIDARIPHRTGFCHPGAGGHASSGLYQRLWLHRRPPPPTWNPTGRHHSRVTTMSRRHGTGSALMLVLQGGSQLVDGGDQRAGDRHGSSAVPSSPDSHGDAVGFGCGLRTRAPGGNAGASSPPR